MPSAEQLSAQAGANTDAVPVGDFAVDTEVTPDPACPGRFTAELSDAWRVFYAFGGCTMAVALRAAERSLARPDLAPLSATATFVAPVPCGPLVVDTDVLRAGRSGAQVLSRLRSTASAADATDVHLSAVFGQAHPDRLHFLEAEYPADALPVDASIVPVRPDEADDPSPFARINYHHQTEFRMGMAGLDFTDPSRWVPGPARSLTWHRLVKEPRLPDGTIDPISYCVPADILGPAVFAKLGPIGPGNVPFITLSLEIGVQFLAPTTSAWVLQHTRIPHAGDGYAYAYVELWDEDGQLIAIATQRANIRPVSMERFAEPDGTA